MNSKRMILTLVIISCLALVVFIAVLVLTSGSTAEDKANQAKKDREQFGTELLSLCKLSLQPYEELRFAMAADHAAQESYKLLLVDTNSETVHEWQKRLPSEWRATSRDDVDLVVCLHKMEADLVDTCHWAEVSTGQIRETVSFFRQSTAYYLFFPNGEAWATGNLLGQEPDTNCERVSPQSNDIYAPPPSFDDFWAVLQEKTQKQIEYTTIQIEDGFTFAFPTSWSPNGTLSDLKLDNGRTEISTQLYEVGDLTNLGASAENFTPLIESIVNQSTVKTQQFDPNGISPFTAGTYQGVRFEYADTYSDIAVKVILLVVPRSDGKVIVFTLYPSWQYLEQHPDSDGRVNPNDEAEALDIIASLELPTS